MRSLAFNTIMPYKVNVVHYMAYNNNAESLQSALVTGSKYLKDSFGVTPLKYSMLRKSYDCTQVMLEYIMEFEDIY